MDEVSNTFFIFLQTIASGLVVIYYPGFFFFFHVLPPLCHWDPSSIVPVLLAERYLIPRPDLRFMIIISSACGGIGDLGNNLNKTEHLKALLAARWRPCCS